MSRFATLTIYVALVCVGPILMFSLPLALVGLIWIVVVVVVVVVVVGFVSVVVLVLAVGLPLVVVCVCAVYECV